MPSRVALSEERRFRGQILGRRQRLFKGLSSSEHCAGILRGANVVTGFSRKSRVIILAYHRVAELDHLPFSLTPVRPRDFEEQVRYLCSNFELLGLEDLVLRLRNGKTLPRKGAVITFDDGYQDNYEHAYPIVTRHHAPATIFLVTGGIEEPFWWDKIRYAICCTELAKLAVDHLGTFPLKSLKDRLKAIASIEKRAKKLADGERQLLTRIILRACQVAIPRELGRQLRLGWDEIREMKNNGITFGAHGVTHGILTKMSTDQAAFEVMQSKKHIEERLKQPITAFCYPNGSYTSTVADIVRKAGFTCAFTTNYGMATSNSRLYELNRIWPGTDVEALKVYTSAAYADYRAILGVASNLRMGWHLPHGQRT